MKPFSIALVLSLALTFAFANSPSEAEVEKTLRECNVTNPVQQNPLKTVIEFFEAGKMMNFSQVEKCFMYCFFQKLHLFDDGAKINIEVLKDWLKIVTGLPVYEVLITNAKCLNDATRNFENKCEKAFVNFHQLTFQEFASGYVNSSKGRIFLQTFG